MKLQAVGILMIIVLLLMSAPPAAAADTAAEEAAAAIAAKTWLSLVDAGQYAESWETAARYFQNAVPKGTWIRKMKAYRAPLGQALSRKIAEAAYTQTLPGVPDGEYVVIRFHTRFANKTAAVETVTPMRDPDGAWRVSGYYIK